MKLAVLGIYVYHNRHMTVPCLFEVKRYSHIAFAAWLQSGVYEAKACEGHTGSVYALALNEAGNFLAAGSTEGVIRISDTRSHAVVASLKGHTENIR